MRALFPAAVRWSVLAVALVIAAVAVGRGLGLRWDPFDLSGRRLRAAEARAGIAAPTPARDASKSKAWPVRPAVPNIFINRPWRSRG